jgi:glutamate-1-semialdehyde 2,1-aminomutase
LKRGIYFAPSQFETGFISTAHSSGDIEDTGVVVREALAGL